MLKILNVLIVVAFFLMASYVGPLASDKTCAFCIFLSGLIILGLCVLHKIRLYNIRTEWILLLFFLGFNSLLNLPLSLSYLSMFVMCVVWMHIRFPFTSYEKLFYLISGFGGILAISVVLQYCLPNIFYLLTKPWFFWHDQYFYVYQSATISHHYSGLFSECSFTGFYLSVAFGIVFVKLLFEKEKTRLLHNFFRILLLALYFWAICLTQKRSMMLAVPELALVFFYFSFYERLSFRKVFVLISASVIFLYFYDAFYALVYNILSKGQEGGIELSQREEFWQLAWDIFKHNPIIGAGLNFYDIAFNQTGIRGVRLSFASAHNSYLQVLAETGIIGFLLYFIPIISQILKSLKLVLSRHFQTVEYRCQNLQALFGISFICIYGMSASPLYTPQELFTLFILLGVLKNNETIR